LSLLRHVLETLDKEKVIVTSIVDRTILITGANRGIGQALVEEALKRGAKRVYAGMRDPKDHPDSRVSPVKLDITDQAQIQTAAELIDDLDVLINNAGIARYDDLSERSVLDQHLAVNLFGTHNVTWAFFPLLARSGGAIVNNLSVNAFAPLPLIPAYSISKAAAFSLTQSTRALVAKDGISVHAVLTGIVDTDMSAGVDLPKASPESVAREIFAGLERDEEDIFPDPMALSQATSWRESAAKELERQYAAVAAAQPRS
jgi:NAD(P)-dependent dehydrogenase (short-subunit alcohol dehydrogenase family)